MTMTWCLISRLFFMRKLLQLILVVSLILITACGVQKEQRNLTVIDGLTMGTTYTIKINSPSTDKTSKSIKQDIESILNNINQIMSTYLSDSELSKLNHSDSVDWIKLSPDLFSVIEQGIHISEETDGNFDITIGPLVNLWGFGPGEILSVIPAYTDIQNAREQVGYQYLQLDKTSTSVRKQIPDLYIDLSGIAKGYAVDKLADYMDSNNFNHYMVEVGGEIRAKGKNTKDQSWRIGIEKPDSSKRTVQQIIKLFNIGMATSGDYRNFFEVEGRRYSHTINPKTGRPVSHNLASVTVLHPSALIADALATGMLVLGPQAGYELAVRENLAALFIIKSNGGFEEKYTSSFRSYLIE